MQWTMPRTTWMNLQIFFFRQSRSKRMININKFISIRKKLGLSQTELCNGICTQSTLSKFENNGRIPSLKILNSLCDRQNINVADIMDVDSNKKNIS